MKQERVIEELRVICGDLGRQTKECLDLWQQEHHEDLQNFTAVHKQNDVDLIRQVKECMERDEAVHENNIKKVNNG